MHFSLGKRLARVLSIEGDTPEAPSTPFRLLDLPKELRLIIYEHLTIDWKHSSVPLDKTRAQTLTIINPSLSGIRILATSRFINAEANPIIKQKLALMLATPPTLLVDSCNLPDMLSLTTHLFPRYTFIDRLMSHASHASTLRDIHAYRSGRHTLSDLLYHLFHFRSLSPDETRTIATFLLRVAKFRTTRYKTPNARPPIAIVISVPSNSRPVPVTFALSAPAYFFSRYVFRMRQPPRARAVASVASLTRRFVREVEGTCRFFGRLSVHVMLCLPDRSEEYGDAVGLEGRFVVAVEQGVNRAGGGRKMVAYMGIYREAEDGSPL